jgi:hypothetical protein
MKLIQGAYAGKMRAIDPSKSLLSAAIENDRLNKQKEERNRLIKEMQIRADAEIKQANYLSSAKGLAIETAKGTGSAILNFAKDTARLPLTIPMKVTQTFAEGVTGKNKTYTPYTKLEKFFYGGEPIQSYTSDQSSITKWAKDKGLSTGQSIALGAVGAGAEAVTDVAMPGIGKVLSKTFLGRALSKLTGGASKEINAVDVHEVISKAEELAKRPLKYEEKTAVMESLSAGNNKSKVISTLEEASNNPARVLDDTSQASSVISYIDGNGVKVITPLSKRELEVLADEIRKIPKEKPGASQIHLDVKTPVLEDAVKSGEAKLVTRDEFISGHPQAKGIFETAQKDISSQKENINTSLPEQPKPDVTPKKESGYAKSLEEKAVEKKMASEFQDLAEYTPAVRKEQAQMTTKLINEDIEKVNSILDGKAELPSGIRGSSLALAVEQHAIVNNDVKLLQKLAKSKIATGISEAGSELSMLAGRNANSPVRIIRNIIKARKENIVKRLKGKKISEARKVTKESIKKAIKKEAPTKETWSNFIKEIKC